MTNYLGQQGYRLSDEQTRERGGKKFTWLRSGSEDSDEAFEYFLERAMAGLAVRVMLFHVWSGREEDLPRDDANALISVACAPHDYIALS